jgi:hypothetical protein
MMEKLSCFQIKKNICSNSSIYVLDANIRAIFFWFTIFLLNIHAVNAQEYEIVIPNIEGIEVTLGESVPIHTPRPVKTALAFQFNDGRIVVGTGENSMWSHDGGHTWVRGKESRMDKTAIDLGDGEIISISRNSKRQEKGNFSLGINRSIDNWNTIVSETAELDIPNASFTVTGSGGRIDGFLFHHGLVELENGDLIGTMYGNFEGDTQLCDGYPTELNQRKYHTIVVFSKDKGQTWGKPVHVAYDKMLGRGIPDDHKMIGKSIPISRASKTSIVPAVTQEGFREADLIQAANGDLICVMRSGGRNPTPGVNLFPTPLYCSRSIDGGKTWTPPEQIADRGICPNLVRLSNGIIVCTYSRPGNWLIFSDDNGLTWKGAFQFGVTGATNYIIESEPNTVQVFHETEENGFEKLRGTYFTVEKMGQD